jgi:hypothetical protein
MGIEGDVHVHDVKKTVHLPILSYNLGIIDWYLEN